MKLTKVVELVLQLEAQKKDLEREMKTRVAELEAKARTARLALLQVMQKQDVSALTLPGLARINTFDHTNVSVADADEFFTYVLNTGKVELLHRRINKAEYMTLLESGEEVPGIEQTTEVRLKITPEK